MGKRWLQEKRRDPYARQARREGYRSRAAYKLLELDARFHLFGPGKVVVDLGASPGGWSQVALERCPGGRVVGIDLARVEPLEGASFLRGDFTDPATAEELARLAGQADVVLSDMSPNISGAYDLDHARSIHLAEQALAFAARVLRPGGAFVAKVFEGDMFNAFRASVDERFGRVFLSHPQASRKRSSEVYVVAKRFLGRPAATPGGPAPEPR